MKQKVKRVLVQGTVTFTVNCNNLMGLVTTDMANDTRALKDWLEDKAFKMIDISDVEVEIDDDRTVSITQETAIKLTGEVLGDDDWKRVITENKQS